MSVTSIADSGAGTLRQAIIDANANGEADIINFDAALDGQTINLTTFDDGTYGPSALLISSDVTIDGGGLSITIARDPGADNMRLFYVTPAGSLTLDGLTISGGVARGGRGGTAHDEEAACGGGGAGLGGLLFNEGTVAVLNSTLTGNSAIGGDGGNTTTLGLFSGGGGGMGEDAPQVDYEQWYDGTRGGGPNYGAGGTVGSNNGSNGGQGGGGGGAYYKTWPNGARGGNGGFGGGGGGGGGVQWNYPSGAGGTGGFGGGGGGAAGNYNSSLGVGVGGFGGGNGGWRSAYYSGTWRYPSGGGGGGGGMGGALFNRGGTITITASTLSGNEARGGGGGTGARSWGGSGYGGAIFNLDGTVSLTGTTFAGNIVTAGSGSGGTGNAAGKGMVSLIGGMLDQVVDFDETDFGDAPDGVGSPPNTYPTLFANNGAAHLVTGPVLGPTVDVEPDGLPAAGADGDDADVADDEDGVIFNPNTSLPEGHLPVSSVYDTRARVTVNLSGAPQGILNAWIDFNRDGDWNDAGEQIIDDRLTNSGNSVITFTIPAGASTGNTYARFRVIPKDNLAAGLLGPTGWALGGEVEDHEITLDPAPMDFGDAPGPSYPTLLADNGARHLALGDGVAPRLGASIDGEADGLPDAAAGGDNADGIDDEDGIGFPSTLYASTEVPITGTVVVSLTNASSAPLNAWMDFNRDGDWNDAGEQIFTDENITSGSNTLYFTIPTTAQLGDTYARFRVNSSGGLSTTGLAADGEVEDYLVTIEAVPLDFGDAPDPSYPTLRANDGARHVITGPYLGSSVDAEADGQPTPLAQGDDAAGDDEDGITFLDPIRVSTVSSKTARISVTLGGAASAMLNGWMDFNRDGDWNDAGEQIFTDLSVTSGTSTKTFTIPAGASLGDSHARFRVNLAGGLSPLGIAGDGEVEDYNVTFEEWPLDFGDAPAPYPGTRASDGARHFIGGPTLGANVDSEADGQPAADSKGDDTNGTTDDEDGIIFLNPMIASAGSTAVFKINLAGSGAGRLDAWVDFNFDGDWNDPSEQIFGSQALSPGWNILGVTMPAGVLPGQSFARFRVSSAGGLSPTGAAADGEVEDYRVSILPSSFPGPYPVDALTDENDGFYSAGYLSFREAVEIANAYPGADTITFDPSLDGQSINLSIARDATYGPSALLISSDVTIDGGGLSITIARDPGADNMRLFYVTPAGSLTLDGLTISGGVARGGRGGTAHDEEAACGGGGAGLGGLLFNEGTVAVLNSTLTGNSAIGGDGGNTTTLGLFSGGGGGMGEDAPQVSYEIWYDGTRGGGPNYGAGGTVGSNNGSNGGQGGGGGGAYYKTWPNGARGGNGGFGGGGGGGGGVQWNYPSGAGGTGGFGGGGGGAAGNYNSSLGVGIGGFGGGAGGWGPPYYSGTWRYPSGGGGGGGGMGGALFNRGGTITITASTLSGNEARGGGGGTGARSWGGSGYGGAIFNLDGTVSLTGTTFAGNIVTPGSGSGGTGNAEGGGIYNYQSAGAAAVSINNSIMADSVGGIDAVNNGGAVTGDYNLIETNTGVPADVIDLTDDPQLGPLADNAGPTFSHSPLQGSPVIDAGDASGALADQRGWSRPVDIPGLPDASDGADIGAIEVTGIWINDISLPETNGGTTFSFTVTRSDNSGDISVQYQTADGSATTADGDYNSASGTLSFAAGGAFTQTVEVTVNGDEKVELDETFSVSLSNAVNAVIIDGQAQATITNDDMAEIAINNVTSDEGDSGTVVYSFFVSLSYPVDTAVTVDYTTADNTATTADGDYQAASGTVTFPAGSSADQTISVTVNGDTEVELDETFVVNLSNTQAAGREVTVADSEGQGAIANDDAAEISINNVTSDEGDSGTVVYSFGVSLSSPLDTDVTVDYTTADNTATTADGDYQAASGSVTFPAGSTADQTISVTVNGDTEVELDETFLVNLSNIQAAGRDVTFADSEGQGAIVNDDAAAISIDNVTSDEGDSGTTVYSFGVSLSSPVDTAVTVDYTTADNTATTADGDYQAASGSVTFPAGSTAVQTISVTVNGDTKVELDETFLVNLSNIQAAGRDVTFADSEGQGAIVNDDAAAISIDNVTSDEGDSGTTVYSFGVSLSSPVDTAVTVDYTTADNTATTADGDYQAASGTVTFPAGSTAVQTISVTVNGDTKVELDETFLVNLFNIQAAGRDVTFADSEGQGAIVNDDAATISIGDLEMEEGDSGTTTFSFPVTLSKAVDVTVTVTGTPADQSATSSDSDFQPDPVTVTFTPGGGLTQNADIPVNGDTKVEFDETFLVNLSNIQAAGRDVTFADSEGQGTIANDDTATISIGDQKMDEGDSGTTTFSFPVTLSDDVDSGIMVDYLTLDFTATVADGDYDEATGTLSFAGTAGETRTVTVTVNGDTKVEADETFIVQLSNLRASGLNVLLGDSFGFGFVTNEDEAMLSINDVTMDETDSGTTSFDFTVTLSEEVDNEVTVSFETADQTATVADNDHLSASGTLSFTGAAGETRTATVTVNGDQKVEPDETFVVSLYNLQSGNRSVIIEQGLGLGTIVNDDTLPGGTVLIDGDAPFTSETTVSLSLAALDQDGNPCVAMQFSNDGTIYSDPVPFASETAWEVEAGDGEKTVYAVFSDGAGNPSSPVSDAIILDGSMPLAAFVPPTPADGAHVSSPDIDTAVEITEPFLSLFSFTRDGDTSSVFNADLSLMLNLDEDPSVGDSDVKAADVSLYGNDANLLGTAWAPGRYGRSLDFDGSTSVAEIPYAASLDITDQVTISAWIMPAEVPAAPAGLVSKAITADDGSYVISIPGGDTKVQTLLRTSGGVWLQGLLEYSLPAGEWHHVAVTYNSATGELSGYVDGVPFPTTFTPAPPAPGDTISASFAPIIIGRDTLGGGYFKGGIDEVRIYGRCLDPGEIALLASSNFRKNSGLWEFTASVNGLSEGTHVLEASASDLAGNGPAVDTRSFSVDTIPPATTALVAGGTYDMPKQVVLTCDDGSGSGCAETLFCLGAGCSPAEVYDGSTLTIDAPEVLRFFSVDLAANSGPVQTETYQFIYTITASAGIGGSITPSGDVAVSHGDTANFTLTTDGTCSVSSLMVDQEAVAPAASYSFVNVTANHAISAVFGSSPSADAGGPYIADFGETLSLDGSASSDPDTPCGDTLVYNWDLDGDGEFDDAAGTAPAISWPDLEAAGISTVNATYTIFLRVTDNQGRSSEDETEVTVYDNNPTAFAEADPNPAECGQIVLFMGFGSSHGRPDRRIVSYEWDFDDDGIFDARGTAALHAFTAFGTYLVTLRVTDDNVPPRTDTTTITITVDQGNTSPTADAGGPYDLYQGSMLLLDGSASFDPDTACGDNIVTYEWDIDNDGEYDDAVGPAPSIPWLEFKALACGGTCETGVTYSLALRTTDSLGATGEDITTLLVRNDNGACPSIILPDAVWRATTRATSTTSVQITDVTGGSVVSVSFYTAGGSSGPFTLWANEEGAGASVRFWNILKKINRLDESSFQYLNNRGALVFETQDAEHRILVSAFDKTGDYAKAGQGICAGAEGNYAATGSPQMIQGLAHGDGYRFRVNCFNPDGSPVTMEGALVDETSALMGQAFTLDFEAGGWQRFDPFGEADLLDSQSAIAGSRLVITPNSGSGRLFCLGESRWIKTGDLSQHTAVPLDGEYGKSPGSTVVLHEVRWDDTSATELLITDATGGTEVFALFAANNNKTRGPFLLWTNPGGAGAGINIRNVLRKLDRLDDGSFVYKGKKGSLLLTTQNPGNRIQTSVRTRTGSGRMTFEGINLDSPGSFADIYHRMTVQSLMSTSAVKSVAYGFNATPDETTVTYRLIGKSGNTLGNPFTLTYGPYSFKGFDPFVKAGKPYPEKSYVNARLAVEVITGDGKIVTGAVMENRISGDPAANVAVPDE